MYGQVSVIHMYSLAAPLQVVSSGGTVMYLFVLLNLSL